MYTGVTTYDVTMPTAKLKLGADLAVRPVKWFGVGVRFDSVQPSNLGVNATNPIAGEHQSFAVLSPRLTFRSHWLSHEEVTLQYTHYFLGSAVTPQPPLPAGPPPPDENVVAIKATMWW